MLQEQKLGEEQIIQEVRTVKMGMNLPSCGHLYLTSPSDHASPSKNMQVLFLLKEQKLDKEWVIWEVRTGKTGTNLLIVDVYTQPLPLITHLHPKNVSAMRVQQKLDKEENNMRGKNEESGQELTKLWVFLLNLNNLSWIKPTLVQTEASSLSGNGKPWTMKHWICSMLESEQHEDLKVLNVGQSPVCRGL